ncbi:MAG: peptidoglycan domain protein [Sulfurimonas sp.]|nr:peptidoglycan domain protein [Sulfurimonas sp.]
MANYYEAFEKFKGIEFSHSWNILHQNKGENGLTYYGIYQSAHPAWKGWDMIKNTLRETDGNIKVASIRLSKVLWLTKRVQKFYQEKFWDRLSLDHVTSQKIAEEMFFFYLNTGNKKRVVKYAQSIIGVKADGILGRKTIYALNHFDEDVFDKAYDGKEISYYNRLVKSSPKRFARFLKGWKNRARMI